MSLDATAEIMEAMRASGIDPPSCIRVDDKIHRFGKSKTCWFVFHRGRVTFGAFGCWKLGISEKFIESRQDITAHDRQRIASDMRAAAVQRDLETKAAQVQASINATSLCSYASAIGINAYLTNKGLECPVDEYGLRQGKEPFGDYIPFGSTEILLIIPIVDTEGATWSLQIIAADGRKRFYPGGKLRGNFYAIGLLDNPDKILICEGIATALTLFEDTGYPVVAAFNANNLVPVAGSIRWKYPMVDILICGDDDHLTEGNPGRTRSIEAAALCGGDQVLPDFTGLPRGPKDTDFNDLKRLKERLKEADHG